MSGLRLKFALACSAALGALVTTGAIAAPTQILRPNTITTAGPVSTTLNGQTFTNQGLQGVNRLSALTTKDFAGDTFGAYSGLDVLPGTWRKTAAKKPAKKATKKKQIVGEGDYQASRSFLTDQSDFVKKNKASIPAMGKDAEKALEGPEGDALREAEASAAGRSRDTF